MTDTPEPSKAAPPPPEPAQSATVDIPISPTPEQQATLDSDGAPIVVEPGQGPIRPATGTFGGYELLGEVGRGGMGIVYKARERSSGRLVALKMMLTDSTQGSTDLRRFVLEARATGELNHPGIVAIHAWGEHQGQPFYTMDFVPGMLLSTILENGPRPCEQAVHYLLGIARAVAAAHALGIVHRDLKPTNVIIDFNDQPRVLDFGLAKRHRQLAKPKPEGRRTKDGSENAVLAEPASSDSLSLEIGPGSLSVVPALPADDPLPSPVAAQYLDRATERGAILGTPAYMSPEQARGEHDRVGPPADVHALGAIFYEMLTGRPPFQAPSLRETLKQVAEQEPRPLRDAQPDVPAILESFCRHCLAKDPSQRYPDAGALADDLDQRWHHAVQGPRYARRTLAAALILILLLALQSSFNPWFPSDLGALLDLAKRWTADKGTMIAEAGNSLALFAGMVCFWAAPILAALAALACLGVWTRHQRHPWRNIVGCAAVAVAAWILDGIGYEPASSAHLAGLATAALLVSGAVGLYRLVRFVGPSEPEPARLQAEPFLQKLFGAPTEPGPRTSAAAGSGENAGLAAFELGKVLCAWSGGSLRRARQKSLDRPVLVWQETGGPLPLPSPPSGGRGEGGAPAEERLPGVVVRHPNVLNLHAVGSGADGWFLVTEAVAATPLLDVLDREGLQPFDAVFLVAQLARAVQAFHDQGSCHGRLRPEWILVRGELDPVLCSCGNPNPTAADLRQDLVALGRLLQEWLPPRPPAWQHQPLAFLWHVADAALEGKYTRAADLADDLETAIRAAAIRRRQRWATLVVAALALLPLLGLVLDLSLRSGEASVPGLAAHLFLFLVPGIVFLGYTAGRSLVQHRRLCWHGVVGPSWKRIVVRALVQLGLMGALGEGFAVYGLATGGVPDLGGGTQLFLAAQLGGFWLLGMSLAGLITLAERAFRRYRQYFSSNAAAPATSGWEEAR